MTPEEGADELARVEERTAEEVRALEQQDDTLVIDGLFELDQELQALANEIRSRSASPSPAERRALLAEFGPRSTWPKCGARTRQGGPCKAPPARGIGRDWYRPLNGRCRLHGGLSTGPKTIEGKNRIRASQAARYLIEAFAAGCVLAPEEARTALIERVAASSWSATGRQLGVTPRALKRAVEGRPVDPDSMARIHIGLGLFLSMK